MTTFNKFALVMVGVVVGVLLSVLAGTVGEEKLGGVYNQVSNEFYKGLKAGTTNQFEIDGSGNVDVDGETTVQGFTQGGGVLNVIDANGGTYTLTQAELLASNVLEMNAGGAGQEVVALTLPATSTMTTLIPTSGDMREWVIDASALSAATTTTVTAGTGVDLISVTNADDVIDGVEFARLTCWRKENTDVACITSELLRAD